MTTEKKDQGNAGNAIIKSFEDLKDRDVSISQSGTVKSTVTEVFMTFKDTWFTQGDFCQRLQKRGPMINKILRELCDAGVIHRIGSNRQYWYKYGKAAQ